VSGPVRRRFIFQGGVFSIFREDLPIQTLFARVTIYGPYGKISGGADSGKIDATPGDVIPCGLGLSPSSPLLCGAGLEFLGCQVMRCLVMGSGMHEFGGELTFFTETCAIMFPREGLPYIRGSFSGSTSGKEVPGTEMGQA
jgi:hypothetical protein